MFHSLRTVRSPSLQLARSLSHRQILDPNYVMPDGRVLSIQRAEESDLDLLFKFFKENFSVQEPLSRYLGVKYEDFGDLFYCPIFKAALQSGLTTVAYNGDQMVGGSTVTVNDVTKEKVDFGKTEFGEDFDENMKKYGITRQTSYIFTLLSHAEAISASLLPPNVDKLCRIETVSVCLGYRGCDISRKLAIESSKLAIDQGLQVMDSICTAAASTRVMHNLGLANKFPVLYQNITDHGRHIVPSPLEDNNTSCNVMQGPMEHIAKLQAPRPEKIKEVLKQQK
ncbi:unnamed protein product [Bursaphelenchus xylophilus]|uniref:(pine wood nematode) hypothetical protein n=1 Tax=Bursaphelenchus xylophilus TaxID=6326 RepID=A0A7I8XHB1_BURXY|nr:unnamed protein product [Bursaphelenchus xylophilus]CAG9079192.1 unnamed protein product [Bursaphelenchus xylophilus]